MDIYSPNEPAVNGDIAATPTGPPTNPPTSPPGDFPVAFPVWRTGFPPPASSADADDPSQRQPPYSIDAEQALLGALMLRSDLSDQVADFLEPFHFFDPLHSAIYETIVRLLGVGGDTQVSPITVAPYFANVDGPDGRTVQQYLGFLASRVANLRSIREYGRIIYDASVRRSMILIAEDMLTGAYDKTLDFPPSAQIEEVETRLFALRERAERGGEIAFAEAVAEAQAQVRRAQAREETGVPTGLVDLDARLGGMQASDLIIVAGRPGMGKSALAVNIALYAARAGVPVGFFSLEMSAAQIAVRALGDASQIPPDRARRGDLNQDEFGRLMQYAPNVGQLPIRIDQTGGLSIAQLAARARRMRRRYGIRLLVVDYLQLMNAGRKTENRVQDVTAITTGLKALAKELGIPIVALSQLSRAVEGREGNRPQLSDLRESGSIEQDADVVMFVYREEYYLLQQRPSPDDMAKMGEWNAKFQAARGKAQIILGKHRQGETGVVDVSFTSDLMRFGNLARQADAQAGGSGMAVRS